LVGVRLRQRACGRGERTRAAVEELELDGWGRCGSSYVRAGRPAELGRPVHLQLQNFAFGALTVPSSGGLCAARPLGDEDLNRTRQNLSQPRPTGLVRGAPSAARNTSACSPHPRSGAQAEAVNTHAAVVTTQDSWLVMHQHGTVAACHSIEHHVEARLRCDGGAARLLAC
jgi:hypothetical protein